MISGGSAAMRRPSGVARVSFAYAWRWVRPRALRAASAVRHAALRGQGGGRQLAQPVGVVLRVPDVQRAHPGELPHTQPVRGHARPHRVALLRHGEAVRPSGDREAGREPFDVPFEGAGVRLVEVVDVEDEMPLGEASSRKFSRCASPHSCTVSPVSGSGARSAAMIAAAPR